MYLGISRVEDVYYIFTGMRIYGFPPAAISQIPDSGKFPHRRLGGNTYGGYTVRYQNIGIEEEGLILWKM